MTYYGSFKIATIDLLILKTYYDSFKTVAIGFTLIKSSFLYLNGLLQLFKNHCYRL